MADPSTRIFRASLRGRLYRDLELPSGGSLEDLAAAIVNAGFTHKGSSSYTQAGTEEAGACETSVLLVNAQAGRADFRPGLGANGSDA